MNNPWIVRLTLVAALVAVAQAAPAVIWVVVVCCLAYVGFGLLREMGWLPARFDSRKAPTTSMAIAIAVDAYDPWQNLAAYMKETVIGQDDASDTVAKTLWRRLKQPRRDKPLGVFCFVGSPGVGKTYFAKLLNERLFGSARKALFHDRFFFDMTEFARPDTIGSLFGQPRGMVGSEEYGRLTRALKDYPDCLVLLDEFEKAHPDVPRRFLTAWNDGLSRNPALVKKSQPAARSSS